MTSHDLDPRYVEQDAKARVAALYLPILGIVMDTIPQLHQYLPESHDRIQNIGLLEDYQGPHGKFSTPTSTTIVFYSTILSFQLSQRQL